MNETLDFEGERYISSKRAAQLFGYTKDYVGQLCRSKKIESRLVGRTWYVSEKALRAHKLAVHHALHRPMHERQVRTPDSEEARELAKVRTTEVRLRTPRPVEATAERKSPSSAQGLHVLTQLDVSYLPEEPVYYEDDRPINPEPVRVTRFENVPIVAPAATARVRAVHAPSSPRFVGRPMPARRHSGVPGSDGVASMRVRRSGVPQRPVQDFSGPARATQQEFVRPRPSRTDSGVSVSPMRTEKTVPVLVGVLVGLMALVGYLLTIFG